MAEKLGVSATGVYASVALFASTATLQIPFSDCHTIASFKSAVDTLPFSSGGTRIDRGLDVAFNEMFQVRNGMRRSVPKAVVVITDGVNGV